MERDYLINNLVAGVYTNTDKNMKQFTENWQENYGNLPLIFNVHQGKINENMERLRIDFREKHPDKRYWLFMDDDIVFNNNNVIEIALKTMIENDLALCSIYQTSDKKVFKKLDVSALKYTNCTWVAGYFMLIDSYKIGLLPFDLDLPTSHGSLSDIEYCMNVIIHNELIGIAPVMVFHGGDYSPKVEIFKITKENEHQINLSVKKFIKNLDKKYLYGNPSIEIVFLGSGKIDVNETIGHQYLKWKYPDIHNEVVSRPHYNTLTNRNQKQFNYSV
tara:strand:+ start:75 stop:899 length:825 start_codon:yes stop_codon:yes gene_type:complete